MDRKAMAKYFIMWIVVLLFLIIMTTVIITSKNLIPGILGDIF